MLVRIDVRYKGAAGSAHIVERGGGDLSHRILQRCGDMEVEAKGIGRLAPAMGNTHRIHEAGTAAIGRHFVRTPDKGLWFRRYRCMFMILAKSRLRRSQAHSAGYGSATLEKFSSISLFLTHCSLLVIAFHGSFR